MRKQSIALAAIIAGGALVVINTAAQPVRREVLKELRIDELGGCQQITAEFQFPVALEGRAPTARGELLLVRINPLQTPEILAPALTNREALVPADGVETPLEWVSWEGDAPEGPQLLLRFAHPVNYEVIIGRDARSVVVLLHPQTNDPAPCQEGSPAAPENEP